MPGHCVAFMPEERAPRHERSRFPHALGGTSNTPQLGRLKVRAAGDPTFGSSGEQHITLAQLNEARASEQALAQQLADLGEQVDSLQTRFDLVRLATSDGLWDMEINHDDPSNPDNPFWWSDQFRRMLGFSNEKDFPNILSSWSSRLHNARDHSAVERLDPALQLDQQRLPLAVHSLAGGHLDPGFAEAVLLDIGAVDAIEADADIVLKHRRHVVRAAGVDGQVVGQRGFGDGVVHGDVLSGAQPCRPA